MLGISAFLIASKYEDIYPPEIQKLAFLSENAFTREQIIEFEGKLLSFLKFDLIFVSELDAFEYLFKLSNLENRKIF